MAVLGAGHFFGTFKKRNAFYAKANASFLLISYMHLQPVILKTAKDGNVTAYPYQFRCPCGKGKERSAKTETEL